MKTKYKHSNLRCKNKNLLQMRRCYYALQYIFLFKEWHNAANVNNRPYFDSIQNTSLHNTTMLHFNYVASSITLNYILITILCCDILLRHCVLSTGFHRIHWFLVRNIPEIYLCGCFLSIVVSLFLIIFYKFNML